MGNIQNWLDWLVDHKVISRTQAKRYARMDKRGAEAIRPAGASGEEV